MEAKQKENLEHLRELGINTYNKTYDECVSILIGLYIQATDCLEADEIDRFKKEIKRIQTPTN